MYASASEDYPASPSARAAHRSRPSARTPTTLSPLSHSPLARTLHACTHSRNILEGSLRSRSRMVAHGVTFLLLLCAIGASAMPASPTGKDGGAAAATSHEVIRYTHVLLDGLTTVILQKAGWGCQERRADMSPRAKFPGWCVFEHNMAHAVAYQHPRFMSVQTRGVPETVQILGSGAGRGSRLQRDWFRAPQSFTNRFAVMMYCFSHPFVRSYLSSFKVLQRAAADGERSFELLELFFNGIFYQVFGDPPPAHWKRYYDFWWW